MTRSRRVIVAFAIIASLLVMTMPAAAAHEVGISIHSNATELGNGTFTNAEVERAGGGDAALVGHDTARASAVARWTFDFGSGSTAYDHVGSNDGAITGATWVAGKSGQALDLDGTGDYINTSDPGVSGSQNRTISAWVKTTSTDSFDTIYSYGTDNTGERFTFAIETGNKFGVRVSGGSAIFGEGSVDLNDGNWHHLAVVLRGSDTTDIYGFIDGQNVSGSYNSQAINTVEGGFQATIGGDLRPGAPASEEFDGDLDDVRIYSEGLDDTEVGWLHTYPSAKVDDDPGSLDTSRYTSADHPVTHSASGFVDLELDSASAEVTFRNQNDAILNQSTISTTGNHTLTWAEDATNAVYVQVNFTTTDGNNTARLFDEGVTANSRTPVIDNTSASPNSTSTTVSSATPTLSVDVTDADLPTAQGDQLTVTFFTSQDGQVGTDTLNANGTASYTLTAGEALGGGSHTWNVTVTDQYGHSVDSGEFDLTVPAEITIRNVTEPHAIIKSASAEIILAGDGETVDRQTVTDGNVSLVGIPTDESYILVIEAPNYHRRTVIVENIFSQSDVYLLNTSFTSVENTFNIDDQTGQFGGESTEIIIQKPINRSVYDSSFAAEYQWVDVSGDRIGADGAYTVDLEDGERYRIIVDNNDGDRRVLGEYQAETAGTVTLRIGELTFNIGPEGETYEYDASYSSSAIRFNYSDPDSTTTSLTVKIFEAGNASNEIYNQTHTGLGTLAVSQPISGGQVDTTWAVSFDGTRDGEAIDGQVVVGQSNLGPGVPLDNVWKNRIALSLLILVAGLTAGGFNAEIGSVAVALTGGVLWWTGWLPAAIGGGVVVLAIFVAVAMTLSTRGGEEIQ